MRSLQRFLDARGCYLFGAGPASEEVVRFVRRKNVPIVGYCDNASGKWGSLRGGIPVVSPRELKAGFKAGEVICISCSQQLAVARQLLELGIPESAIYPYLSSMFSTYYDPEILEANSTAIEDLRVAAMDAESKVYLDHLLAFRKEMNPFSLQANPFVTDSYQYRDLWSRLPEHPCILDVGAFTGDTARLFFERTQGRAEIFSFEPLSQNFKALSAWILADALHGNIHAEHALVGSENGPGHVLYSAMEQGEDRRASELLHENASEPLPVDSVSLDAYARKHGIARVDFIKMDIEGAELDAVRGATELISRDRPILAISGYHEPDHLWALPDLIQSHFPFYRLAIGHDFRVHFEVEFYCFPE